MGAETKTGLVSEGNICKGRLRFVFFLPKNLALLWEVQIMPASNEDLNVLHCKELRDGQGV